MCGYLALILPELPRYTTDRNMHVAMLLFFAVVACALTAGAAPSRPSFPTAY